MKQQPSRLGRGTTGSSALALALLLGLVMAALLTPRSAVAQTGDLGELRADYAILTQQVTELGRKRATLEATYDKVTAKITAHKRSTNGGILSGIQLESLLENGRVLSNELYEVQRQIRDAEGDLEKVRGALVTSFDARIATLEDQIVTGTDRGRAIAEMNALLKERHQYRRRESTPDLKIANLPRVGEVPSDPEEMLASAAELDDNERKLRARITEIEATIGDLEKDRRLRRRARMFRTQESFFDDAMVGSRRVAVARASSVSSGDSGPANTKDDAPSGDSATTATPPEGISNGGGTNAEPAPDESYGAGGDELNNDGQQGDFDGTSDAAPVDIGEGSRGDDTLVDPEPSNTNFEPTVTVGPTRTLPGVGAPGDPFASGSVVVRTDVESDRLDGRTDADSGGSLSQRLQRLRRARARLEARASELKERSAKLKVKAGEF